MGAPSLVWQGLRSTARRALGRPPRPRQGIVASKEQWDEQYASGGWSHLWTIDEFAHYAVLVGYLDLLKPGGSVLDVGCGDGVLTDRLEGSGRRYAGIDLSEVAINTLRERSGASLDLEVADASAYTTDDRFDAVVFNESIFLFESPHEELQRYRSFLAPGGIILVSTFQTRLGPREIMKEMVERNPVISETMVTQAGQSWRIAAFGWDGQA